MIEKLAKHQRKFFWQNKSKKKKYYMVKWKRVCKSKKKGGLGVKDLRKQNLSLLVKWWWKLETQDGLWQRIAKAKYLRNKTVVSVKFRFNDSPCWKAVMQVKEIYMAGRGIKLRDGSIIRFWKDACLDGDSLMNLFPELYDICQEMDITFKQAAHKNFDIFRRRLSPGMIEHWNYIVNSAHNINLSVDSDVIFWKWTKSGMFTTKSVYEYLERDSFGPNYKWIWKAKIPLKIKIFLWQVMQDAILTRDNMKKRKWGGNPRCSFCDQLETRNHLFFPLSYG